MIKMITFASRQVLVNSPRLYTVTVSCIKRLSSSETAFDIDRFLPCSVLEPRVGLHSSCVTDHQDLCTVLILSVFENANGRPIVMVHLLWCSAI